MMGLCTLRTRLVALVAAVIVALAMTFVGLVPDAEAKTQRNRGDQQSSQKCSQQGSGQQNCSQNSKQKIKRR